MPLPECATLFSRILHSAFQPAGMAGDTSVRGVISYQGPPDMVALHDDIQARFVRLISPTTYVSSDCPPTLLLQGTHDLLVDHEEVKKLHKVLRQVNAPVFMYRFPTATTPLSLCFPEFHHQRKLLPTIPSDSWP